MTNNEKAALIGFYRSGATLLEIQHLTGVKIWEIELIITRYLTYETLSI